MKGISFVLPMYNEAKNIKKAIETLASASRHFTEDYEILVIDDASTDESVSVVRELCRKDEKVKLFSLKKNTKFAGALREGVRKAEKEIIVYTDSDLSIDEGDIKRLLPFIEDADIVQAFSKGRKGETPWRTVVSFVYNLIVRRLFFLPIRDINSSFKIFRKSALERMALASKSPFIDAEIFIRAKRQGCRILQVPIVFKERSAGESFIARPEVIFACLRDILRFRFLPGRF